MDICEKRSIRPPSTFLFPKENFPAGAAFPPPAGKIRYTEGDVYKRQIVPSCSRASTATLARKPLSASMTLNRRRRSTMRYMVTPISLRLRARCRLPAGSPHASSSLPDVYKRQGVGRHAHIEREAPILAPPVHMDPAIGRIDAGLHKAQIAAGHGLDAKEAIARFQGADAGERAVKPIVHAAEVKVVERTGMRVPVSYTHVDVYKRQVLAHAGGVDDDGAFRQRFDDQVVPLRLGAKAVSYTHLSMPGYSSTA